MMLRIYLHAARFSRHYSILPPHSLKPAVSNCSMSMATSVPQGAWDSHMHVCEPLRFPVSPTATYQPHKATLKEAQKNAEILGLPNLVFVQPSTYGNDNRCLLDALQSVGPKRGRGVVVFDPTEIDPKTLEKWHSLGVRGARINFKSVGKEMAQQEMLKLLESYQKAIGRMNGGWALQLFVDMSIVPQLEEFVDRHIGAKDGMKLVLDHFGSPGQLHRDLSKVRGWDAMCRVMKNGGVYVKISAPYRLSKDPEYNDLEAIAKELFMIRNGKGVVFASDWPHTRFEGLDIQPWLEKCLQWCGGDQHLVNQLFRDNARELWSVHGPTSIGVESG